MQTNKLLEIVVLDSHPLDVGDLDWSELRSLGTLTLYEHTAPGEVVARASSAEVVLVNKVVLDRPILEQLPRLKYIGLLASGYNNVDIAYARERGIVVTNASGYGTMSVAQHTLALMLAACNEIPLHNSSTHEGEWKGGWCYWKRPIVELAGKQLGIVGLGNIGYQVSRMARALGMWVVAHHPDKAEVQRKGARWVPLDELFATSDVVSLHCPLTAETEKLVNAQRLSLMKPTAVLVNTARGALIDEEALFEALKNHRIKAAALDVLTQEPPPPGHPLLTLPNCIVTPHNAWSSYESRSRLLAIVVDNLRAFIEGNPKNVVNF
ncbi:glycerate dehydrogenase [Thermonema lapsum]|uniref:Glycerate dehydrogenase n=1 Tax=Thermonema lapsum TaxID=28195 RepID=A0A846MNS5_9BACT|nr:D-2-hydroxyacid dehydrogenase [Thermonema lapsum]NIK73060.1 glycerate dehydrogenase [Thermonema lapsum]